MIQGLSVLALYASVSAAQRSLNARIAKAINAVTWNDLQLPDISVEDIQVLFAITTVDRASLIAEHLRKESPTISHVITRLTNHGWISRTKSDQDGRVFRLALTERGQAVLKAVADHITPIDAPEPATVTSAERIARRVL